MHYGIITFGSRGDIQPYIALALGLKNRGHWAGILGNENFSELVTAHEIDFYSLPGNIEAMLQTPQMTGILKSANTIAYFKELRKLTRQMQGGIIEKMITHCKAFDVLIATPLTIMWVFSVAESLKKPWAIIQLSVPTVPTAEFPFPGLDLFNNRIYNRFTYRLIRWFFWNENKKDINTHRAYLNLPPLKKSLIQIIDEQEILHLYAFSRFLISRPADWPGQADITGFLTAKAPTASKEKDADKIAEIGSWLQQGKPPVYIGFGSIPVPDPQTFSNVLTSLLDNTDERYIFCEGWTHNIRLPQNNRLLKIKSASHAWLFPQCRLAVVHGGIGTIGAALLAKLPVVVVSVFGDQPMWGKFIEEKGMGIHVPFKKLTGQKILNAIKKADTEEIRTAARYTGTLMEKEDGVQQAISKLEAYFTPKGNGMKQ